MVEQTANHSSDAAAENMEMQIHHMKKQFNVIVKPTDASIEQVTHSANHFIYEHQWHR